MKAELITGSFARVFCDPNKFLQLKCYPELQKYGQAYSFFNGSRFATKENKDYADAGKSQYTK